MRPFIVELLDERVEAGLLLQAVHAGRTGRLLLQGQVHALVAAVLLGMAGLDALDLDAPAQPPDGELGEAEEAVGAGEENAIIGADGAGEAALTQPTEGGDRRVLSGRFQRLAEQQEARGVANSARFAADKLGGLIASNGSENSRLGNP